MSAPMSRFHRKVLEKCGPDLIRDLDTDDITLDLIADDVVTRDDVDKINSVNIRREKVKQLLDILPRRGSRAYPSFLRILSKLKGSEHLHAVLKDVEDALKASGDHLTISQDCVDSICDVPMPEAVELQPGPLNPHLILTNPQLQDLAKGLGVHWETLALKLGLSGADIYQCKEDNKFNNQNQVYEMLCKWKNRNGRKAVVGVLLQACKDINDLAEDTYEFLYNLQ